MELKKVVTKVGSAGHVILPKVFVGQEVIIICGTLPVEIKITEQLAAGLKAIDPDPNKAITKLFRMAEGLEDGRN